MKMMMGTVFGYPEYSRWDDAGLNVPTGVRQQLLKARVLMNLRMNITALRPRFIRYLEPVADVFIRLRITPNQISLLALIAGFACAYCFYQRHFVWGSSF